MSLEYYLYCKKKYNDIICYIDSIIENYDLINDITISEQDLDAEHYQIFKPEHNKLFFIDKLKQVEQLKKICDKKVIELCKHDFVDDLIDITPEKSKYIRYCRICEYTEN